jgi:hypothetical protein
MCHSNYGFDPLGLSKDAAGLKRFTESEVIHCRWAMLGAAGCLGVEALGQGNWYDAPLWVSNYAVLLLLEGSLTAALVVLAWTVRTRVERVVC